MTVLSPSPESYDGLRSLVSARYPAMSGRLRQIAEFLLAEPDTVALQTVAAVAERAGVQPSALIRFAQSLGYDGFSEMQRVLRARLVERAPAYVDRLREHEPDVPGSPGQILSHFVQAGHHALDQLRESVDARALDAAVDLLAGAEVIHLMAQRRAYPVVAYMAYGVSHLGRRMQLIDGVGGMALQQARSMTARDVLVAVSFRPYAAETLAVAESARERAVPLLALTDSPLSSLARLGNVVLCVADAEFQGFRALTASMCLATSIILGLGQRILARDGAATVP